MKKENKPSIDWSEIKFPAIRNTNPRTIADSIEPVIPMEQPPIEKQYENHWGDTVTRYKDRLFGIITSTSSNAMYGDHGHAFGMGWYIVNENLEHIYSGCEEYDRLFKECLTYWQVIRGLQKRFKSPEYQVQRGRGDRLVVNDKIIKGPLIYPGSVRGTLTVESEINALSEFIQKDIDRGRIIAGEFGIEK